MILLRHPLMLPSPTKLIREFSKPVTLSPNTIPNFSIFSSSFISKASFKCCCINKDKNSDKGFSVLRSDIPWDNGSVWSTMGLYFFSLHIPLSFGGLSVVAQMIHGPYLDPQTEAISILVIQFLELSGALAMLKYTAKSHFKLASFFQSNKLSKERNWVLSTVLGFALLMLVALLTSFLADRLVGPKVVNNPILKDILSSGIISNAACFLTYCFVTPLLEETVYRGFLLTSLTSTMKWQQAVVVSSCIFSLAHFSVENSVQLFIVGCILGCSYCWSGNLSSSFVLHSLYNAVTLIVTILS